MPRGMPSLRHHKPSGRAVVTLDGRDIYLGDFGSSEAKERYHRVLAEWLETKRLAAEKKPKGVSAADVPAGPTVVAILLAFFRHAKDHYRLPDGTPSGELQNVIYTCRPVRKLYGLTPAAEFGPLALRAVRGEMIRGGLARSNVNARVNRVRRVFRWAASVELVPATTVVALETVAGLQKGRSEAPEAERVEPVSMAVVEATLTHLSRPVAGMVRLQLLTGMRPGEVMAIRPGDVFQGEPNHTYEPDKHKTAWRGKRRVVPLGPRARALLEEFPTDPSACYFRPSVATAEYKSKRAAARKTPHTPSSLARKVKARPTPKGGDRYNRTSYLHAIWRACDVAFPHPELSKFAKGELTPEQVATIEFWRKDHRWHPNQLRHLVATEVRAEFGLEASQTVLGHARADTTQIYAERDLTRAHDVASKRG